MSNGDSFSLLGDVSNYDVIVDQSGVVTITDAVDIAYDTTPSSIEVSVQDLITLAEHAKRIFEVLSKERMR